MDLNNWESNKVVEKTKIEEYLNIDEGLIELEKNTQAIRLDMTTVELPIFSKDTRRKKNQIRTYFFKSDRSSYLEIEPMDGFSIPGEFEERVFIALTKIMRNNKYKRTFYVTANEIIENLNVKNPRSGYYFIKLKQAIRTLANTMYRFKNSLYSSELGNIIENEIETTMMNIEIITRKDANSSELDQFKDGRIKEIYRISFSDYFYNNIISKGYLTFDSEKLLEMENAVTRSLYQLIEKWRFYETYLKKPAFFIARRIPLKWEKKTISRTIQTIEHSCKELVDRNLLKKYNIIKNKKWELAEFEFIFDKSHNKFKSDTYWDEKRSTKDIDFLITSTKNTNKSEETQEKEKIVSESLTEEEIKEYLGKTLEILPSRAKNLKTIPKVVENALKKYGAEYVLVTAEYVFKQDPKHVKIYFEKALQNNWAEELILLKKEKEVNKNKLILKTQKIEDAQIIEDQNKEQLYETFKNLPEKEQKKIEQQVLDEYKKESNYKNLNKGIQQRLLKSFNIGKKIFIQNYMSKYNPMTDVKKEAEEITKVSEDENKVKEELIIRKEKINIQIEEHFSNISMFLLEILRALKKTEINEEESKMILQIIPTLKFFEGELGKYKVNITYVDDSNNGKIKITEQ